MRNQHGVIGYPPKIPGNIPDVEEAKAVDDGPSLWIGDESNTERQLVPPSPLKWEPPHVAPG
jgi:hypothetical protein